VDVRIAPLALTVVEALFSLKNSEAMLRWMPGTYPLDPDVFWSKMEAQIAAGCGVEQASYVIEVDGEVAGSIGHFHRDGGPCEVGYFVGERWWGRGVATRALELYLAELRRLGVEGTVHAGHAVENVASGRVLAKAGFGRVADQPFTLDDGTVVMDAAWIVRL
jgi:ribosomal-protein-alanine N-acetyltransferase